MFRFILIPLFLAGFAACGSKNPLLPTELNSAATTSGTNNNAPIVSDSVPFTGGANGYKVYRAPTMVITQKNTILAFSEGRVNGPSDEDDMDVVLRRSTDGGRSWEPLQVLVNDGKNPCKNASPVVLPNGRILLVYLWNPWIPSEDDRKKISRKVFTFFSDDDGKTWSNGNPKNLGTDITQTAQKPEWGWTGLGPVHGIVKQFEPNKGRILLASRHNAAGLNMVSHVIYSDDNGKTWKIGGSVNRPRTSESTIVELSNGQLLLSSRNQNGSEDYRVNSISTDGGLTFSKVWLEEQLVEPRGVQASLLFYGLNAKTGKGNILFSNPNNRTSRSDGTLKLSIDNGATWSESVVYAPKRAPYFTGYSDIVKMPNGDIGVLYERGDFSPDDKKGDRYAEVGFTVVSASAFPSLNSGR